MSSISRLDLSASRGIAAGGCFVPSNPASIAAKSPPARRTAHRLLPLAQSPASCRAPARLMRRGEMHSRFRRWLARGPSR